MTAGYIGSSYFNVLTRFSNEAFTQRDILLGSKHPIIEDAVRNNIPVRATCNRVLKGDSSEDTSLLMEVVGQENLVYSNGRIVAAGGVAALAGFAMDSELGLFVAGAGAGIGLYKAFEAHMELRSAENRCCQHADYIDSTIQNLRPAIAV